MAELDIVEILDGVDSRLADFVTDYDAAEIAENVVRDMIANGELGNAHLFPEDEQRISDLEREVKEQNYWKSDRNHSHQDILARLDKIEKALRLIRVGFPF